MQHADSTCSQQRDKASPSCPPWPSFGVFKPALLEFLLAYYTRSFWSNKHTCWSLVPTGKVHRAATNHDQGTCYKKQALYLRLLRHSLGLCSPQWGHLRFTRLGLAHTPEPDARSGSGSGSSGGAGGGERGGGGGGVARGSWTCSVERCS